jgi:hypothetical protein
METLTVTVSPCPTLIMESPPSRLIASLNSRISFLVHILAAEMGEYSVSEKKSLRGVRLYMFVGKLYASN